MRRVLRHCITNASSSVFSTTAATRSITLLCNNNRDYVKDDDVDNDDVDDEKCNNCR